jgi:CBS domain-containing protein
MGGGRDIGHEQLYDRRARSGYESRWQRESLTAREVMTADVKSVSPESSLADVARIMKDENCGIVPVIDDDRRLRGVVTDRDIVLRTLAEGKNPNDVRVGELMTDDVNGVTPEETVCEVIELMGSKQVRRVPVVDRDDRLLGIISLADVANRADYDEDLQEALEKISTRRSFWSRLWS